MVAGGLSKCCFSTIHVNCAQVLKRAGPFIFIPNSRIQAHVTQSFQPHRLSPIMPTFPQPTSIWHDDTYAAISPTRSELSLAGKTVVVTGGGIGIGGEIAHSVAAAGCTKLILLGRREDALQANKARILSEFDGADVMTISVDVSDRELVNEAFRTAAAHFGKLDVLINNAAYYSGLTSINDSTLESWYPSFEINVKGAFLVTKGFLAYSVPKATVLHISSGIAHINPPWAGYSAYAASKAAATRFFEYLQSEMPDFQVISIHPGTVRTEMSARVCLQSYYSYTEIC